MNFKIGIDLGGTKTEVILLTEKNETILRTRKPTRKDSYESILTGIIELIELAKEHIPPHSSFRIGIGIPGIIDKENDIVINANTTILIGKPLKSDLEEKTGHPISIENDANCFVLAETIAGATRDYTNVFGIIMGTGCGGGIVINKKIYKGKHGIAGEWGHFSIDSNGPECWCGNRGCIETYISGSGIENLFFQKSKKRLKVPEILQLVNEGDATAKEIFDFFLENFGRAVGGIVSILDPDAIVIGGGLSNIEELYTTGYEKMKQYAFHHNVRTLLLKNQLGDSAGVFGAAWLEENKE